ncbi:hypothetical protein B0J17DRAFT_275069 [Rhizoctonia solani]|nr:hypothetical protein B0J17DRAFT_275069 [Rhizoctonia solani]
MCLSRMILSPWGVMGVMGCHLNDLGAQACAHWPPHVFCAMMGKVEIGAHDRPNNGQGAWPSIVGSAITMPRQPGSLERLTLHSRLYLASPHV